ncbi:NAD(P)-dependent alcohol dehydrogenase [Rheinheimera soli]|uniref:NADPH:quinone reductase-like Zn-dependent oxidoreductase n=1 Tax=Rheinheimera soli TaxID=443616 RepID=A0ABU1VVD0_9GAMM|nr:NAD(P)-dependent alcohol dehydrogenase [Rheinheimera soli]MDR7119679.1 NADPH:quinone reductase-like Zn-dependent oxidoreductase [Rheinheimera soli]
MSLLLPSLMQAWICTGYGGADVLQLQYRPLPVVGAGDILVQVCASTVSSGDVRIRSCRFPSGMGLIGRLIFGLRRPRQQVLGVDVAGVVKQVGTKVTDFKPGDHVVAMTGFRQGAHAEYCVVSASHCTALKPATLSFTEAVALPFGGLTAMHFLKKAALKTGEHLLIIGASGAVGVALVQLARLQGIRVTTLTSQRNQALMRELGADETLAYDNAESLPIQSEFDVIIDAVAARSFRECLPLLKTKGRYVAVAGGLPELMTRRKDGKVCISGPSDERSEDLTQLLQLAAQGQIHAVTERIYPSDSLPDAHRHSDTGRKRGAVVVIWPAATETALNLRGPAATETS